MATRATAKTDIQQKTNSQGTLKVTQVRSKIGSRASQRETLRSLGLHRINDTVLKEDRPEIRGMVAAVAHLITVEEVR